MILLVLVNFLSVFAFVIRISAIFRTRRMIERRSLTIFGTCVGFAILPATRLLPEHPALFVLLSHAIASAFMMLPAFVQLRNNSFALEDRLDLLDALILEMRSGRAFRGALLSVARDFPARTNALRDWLKSFVAAVDNGKDPWREKCGATLHSVVLELGAIDRHAHHPLSRLTAWRKSVRKEIEFRRRSGQVTLQIRLQAALAALIYIGILLFSWDSIVTGGYFGLIFASIILFIAGLAVIFLMGRAIRWNF